MLSSSDQEADGHGVHTLVGVEGVLGLAEMVTNYGGELALYYLSTSLMWQIRPPPPVANLAFEVIFSVGERLP